ncbi:lipopolysaccharide biosynthesis protein [Herbaspirillum sp.]|uniref:lipopolysaccharide biosynthesis protein n=1 Tax=Herbaspirillum sp. TaxID=1890675 RepID=UPI001B110D55|nr:lipopolysaccharide biosynthesis protein [Herbaspirillum sp.]MBO9535876.1 lipopolysaccharide biosynthesis protein [Herbaspirillum sp.]
MPLMPAVLASRLSGLESRFRIWTIASTMVPTMGALGLQLVTFALTARGLGVEQFGRYTALLAVVAVGVEAIGMGGADLLVRAVSRNKEAFGTYYGNMLLGIALTLPVAVLAGTLVAAGILRVEVALPFIALALFAEIGLARVSASTELAMVAHAQTARAGWVRVATVVARLVAALLFFIVLERHALDEWIVCLSVQSVAMMAFYAWLGARLYGAPRWVLLGGEMKSGFLFCANQGARAMQSNLDRMVLSRFADAYSLGVYGAASRILQLGLFPMQVMTRIFYPKFFQHGANGMAASRAYALRVAPALFGAGVLSGAMVACAALLAPHVLGRDFAGSVEVTAGLALSLPFIALQYPAADALTGAGRQGIRAVIYGVAAVGFGFVLVAGVWLKGVPGLIGAFVFAQFLLAAILWGAAFRCKDVPDGIAPANTIYVDEGK